MTHRMVAALLALVGLLISVYLWLWKVGAIGVLACGDGGCETVQLSKYGDFLGVPVAFWGMLAYGGMLASALIGLQPRWQTRREPTLGLLVLSGAGVAFSAYLTYLEAAVIHAWCRWCVVSAVLVTGIFLAALTGWRTLARGTAADESTG
jgi:uncharacterized membrane protein